MRPPHTCQHNHPLANHWRREWDSNPRGLRLVVFKTTALNRSAISPKPTIFNCMLGRRDRNRTCNLRFWRPLLCLIELPAYRPPSYHTGTEFASSIAPLDRSLSRCYDRAAAVLNLVTYRLTWRLACWSAMAVGVGLCPAPMMKGVPSWTI
jgi:hypothetical protein